jgi:cytochrome c553
MSSSLVTATWRWHALGSIALVVLASVLPVAIAADALRGRDLYLSAAAVKQRPGLKSCVQCHGLPPEGKLWGASAVQLQGTIGAVVDMAAYANELTTADLVDLSVFLQQPLAVPLPQPWLAPLQPRFAAQPGTASPVLTFALENRGSAPFTLGATPLRLVGASAGEFMLDAGSCLPSTTMPPGASCAFQLRFHPAAGSVSGTRTSTELRVDYQSIAAPTVVQVESTAAPVAALSLSSTGLSFSAPPAPASASSQAIVLSNGGQDNLMLQVPSLAGTAAGDFSVAGPCAQASSLASGAQCELQVRFRPAAAGVRTAQLQLAWDGGAVSIALTGTSTAASSPAAPPPAAGAATTTNSGGGAVTWLWAIALLAGMQWRARRAVLT